MTPEPNNEYGFCYDIISLYANNVLCIFADHWSRFPNNNNAKIIIERLCEALSMYENIEENDTAEKINMAICILLKNYEAPK